MCIRDRVHVWGNNVKGTLNLPEEIQGHVTAISAGRYHYTVILDDGSVVTWGDNNFGQTKVPNFNGTVASVSSGYYSSYAITEDGQVKGCLLYTSQFRGAFFSCAENFS